jgi:L-2-hydroxyglutarate oxidase
MRTADVAIAGGGIVGLATAWKIAERFRGARVVVLEKEDGVARHQTGHNSGVIHSGIYYEPGSLKARNCRRGKALLEAFCREHGIAHETCGKVVVAVDDVELPRLAGFAERARANGVRSELIDRERLRALEPHAGGVRALHVPETGIVDYVAVAEKLAELVRVRGGEIVTGAHVRRIRSRGGEAIVESSKGEVSARLAINCAGLHSDRVLARSGERRPARIVPFRGEYYELVPAARALVRGLIYPVPDPRFPFLGVHFTRTLAGGVECGPNAVLALAREGYTWLDVSARDLADTLAYGGFWRLARRHWRYGGMEVRRSLSRRAFARSLQRLVPDVKASDLVRAPAGVRAQALEPDGELVDDFLLVERRREIHVCNAPSPAATSSLAIGETIAERAAAFL